MLACYRKNCASPSAASQVSHPLSSGPCSRGLCCWGLLSSGYWDAACELQPRTLGVPLGDHSIFMCESHSGMSDSAAAWTVAHQASLSMGFSRQKSQSGQLFPFPGDAPNPGTEPRSLLHCRWILYQLSYQGSPWYFYSQHWKNLVALQHAWTSKCVCILCWQSLRYVKQKNIVCKKCQYKSGFLLHIDDEYCIVKWGSLNTFLGILTIKVDAS